MGTTHADYLYGTVPCVRNLTKEEIDEAYEKNTGVLIADRFDEDDLDYVATPFVLKSPPCPRTVSISTPSSFVKISIPTLITPSAVYR